MLGMQKHPCLRAPFRRGAAASPLLSLPAERGRAGTSAKCCRTWEWPCTPITSLHWLPKEASEQINYSPSWKLPISKGEEEPCCVSSDAAQPGTSAGKSLLLLAAGDRNYVNAHSCGGARAALWDGTQWSLGVTAACRMHTHVTQDGKAPGAALASQALVRRGYSQGLVSGEGHAGCVRSSGKLSQ